MSRADVATFCRALPGAERSDPWGGGHDCWKVGDKMFALVGARDEGVSVKTASVEDAALLIDLGRAERAPYLHRSWVQVRWNMADTEEIADRVRTSYTLIRAGLPKKVQATLGPLPG